MHSAWWIPKATNTRSEYTILITFPLQQWLHERAPHVPCYVLYIACLVTADLTHALSFSRDAVIKPTFSVSGFTV
jgi:hypothetical protein